MRTRLDLVNLAYHAAARAPLVGEQREQHLIVVDVPPRAAPTDAARLPAPRPACGGRPDRGRWASRRALRVGARRAHRRRSRSRAAQSVRTARRPIARARAANSHSAEPNPGSISRTRNTPATAPESGTTVSHIPRPSRRSTRCRFDTRREIGWRLWRAEASAASDLGVTEYREECQCVLVRRLREA